MSLISYGASGDMLLKCKEISENETGVLGSRPKVLGFYLAGPATCP
jgi:hypothetical protein